MINNYSDGSLNSFPDKELESQLKDLLERMLIQMEKFISTKDDLNQVENELKDYENLSCLVGIIKVIFQNLMDKIDNKLTYINNIFRKLEKQVNPREESHRSGDEYEKLETIIQKHEAEIRNHIRLEQQLKLYAESVQQKLDESESTRQDLLETTKTMINNIKRDNQKMNESMKQLRDENEKLKTLARNDNQNDVKKSIQMLTKQSQQIKGMVQKQTVNRSQNSQSEHKVMNPDDVPTQSQGSFKQNYMPYAPQQQETIKTSSSDIQRLYGKLLQNKNHSLSTIQDIAQNKIYVKRSQHALISQTASKNSSQNTSVIQKQTLAQQRNRSKSGHMNTLHSELIIKK